MNMIERVQIQELKLAHICWGYFGKQIKTVQNHQNRPDPPDLPTYHHNLPDPSRFTGERSESGVYIYPTDLPTFKF